jgi:hypothetical protein
MKELLLKVLETPEANSRLVFLVQGVCSAIATVILAVAYVVKEPTNPLVSEGYVMLMATLLGGGSLLHGARALSKKAGQVSR